MPAFLSCQTINHTAYKTHHSWRWLNISFATDFLCNIDKVCCNNGEEETREDERNSSFSGIINKSLYYEKQPRLLTLRKKRKA